MKRRVFHIPTVLLIILMGNACASVRSLFGINPSERAKPISNPFSEYKGPGSDPAQNMILRTKKGDRSIELEIPGNVENLSDFVLPVSPHFKDSIRSPASLESSNFEEGAIQSYKNHPPTVSDREIASSMPHNSPELDIKRKELESNMNLAPAEDDLASEKTSSYLASLDHIKLLYKSARYEAALLETDEMIRQYQTDSKLYEMRGTLLDRLGRKELALKAWSQSLRLDPTNDALKKFIDRKRQTAGLP